MGKEARWHNGRESRLMAMADGWVMVRRPGAAPYTMTSKEWADLPDVETGRELEEEYRRAALAQESKE